MVLITALLSLSMAGPASQMVYTTDSLVLTSYAWLSKFIYCSIGCPLEARCAKPGTYWPRVWKNLTKKNIMFMLLSPAFFLGYVLGFNYGAGYLIQSHLQVTSTSWALIAPIIQFVMQRRKPNKKEILALTFVVIAMALMFTDPSAARVDGHQAHFYHYLIVLGLCGPGAI